MLSITILITITATIAAIIIGALLFTPATARKRVYFVGPHCSGKTESIASILALKNPTVPSLSPHTVVANGVEIVDTVQKNLSYDFINKFHINTVDTFLFFVKNEEEMGSFPDLEPFKVKFVMWRRPKNSSKERVSNLVYLEESPDKLVKLIDEIK